MISLYLTALLLIFVHSDDVDAWIVVKELLTLFFAHRKAIMGVTNRRTAIAPFPAILQPFISCHVVSFHHTPSDGSFSRGSGASTSPSHRTIVSLSVITTPLVLKTHYLTQTGLSTISFGILLLLRLR
jgi:hypothetical protein